MTGETNLKACVLMSIFLLGIVCPAAAGKIIYVDADAPGSNDGSNWENAYDFLQDALADANSAAKPVEIRVAQGIYKPDQGIGITPGDREATFQLINGVTLKGGFAGFGEPDPNARNVDAYETILSGDLTGNDIDVNDLRDLLNVPCRAENSYHVVTSSKTDATATVDGFTITGGNANEKGFQNREMVGGGMYNSSGSPTIKNCTFSANSAAWYAGGMFNSRINFNPTLTNCTFSRNYAGQLGGGMVNNSSSPTLNNCTFIGNSSGEYGGGMIDSQAGSKLTNCTFSRNSAIYCGGGISIVLGSTSLTQCTFISNRSDYGGAIFTGETCFLALTNCTFAANSATFGNALACDGIGSWGMAPSHLRFTNCILWDDGDEIWNNDGSTITITYSDVRGGWPGIGNIDADPCFIELGHWEDPCNTPTVPWDDIWVEGDYHLKSEAGRWDANEGRWTRDEVTSPCIDAGNPADPIGHEVFPNGGIINMGTYGGTAGASKSYFGQPVCETIVAGDINGDCKVNFKDFALMAFNWLRDSEVYP